MKNKTILFLVFSFIFSNAAISDTIVCCQSDTLKLAYEYDNMVYNDGCDIQINDVLIISPESDVYVQINPVDSSFNYWLSRYTPHHCPQIPCYFNNYITKISEDGIYSAYEYFNIQYQTYFKVIKGDSSDMPILVFPAEGNPPKYELSIKNDFASYVWSNGASENVSIIDQPGNYNISATNHCGQTYVNNLFIPESGFLENQFYTNQKTGTNVHYVDLIPDSIAHYYHGGSVPPYKNILFDLNQDDIIDLDFSVNFSSANGGYAASFFVTPINGCEVLTTENSMVAMDIDENCVLNNLFHYSGEENVIMFKDSWIMFSMSCHAGRWQNSDNYLGFRFPVNNDIVYGWMHIKFSTEWAEMDLIIDDFAYSVVQSGERELNSAICTIYPNPCHDIIKISTLSQNYSVTLFDVFGKRVFSQEKMNGDNDVNLHDLKSGIYLMILESGTFRQTQKVIKQL